MLAIIISDGKHGILLGMSLGIASLKPTVWPRYADDTFKLWPHQETVQILLDYVNPLHNGRRKQNSLGLPASINNSHREYVQDIHISQTNLHQAML